MLVSTVRTALLAVILAGSAHPASGQQLRESTERGWIGISFEVRPVEDRRRDRVVITDVRPGSPAGEAGLRPGDRLVRINDIRRVEDFANLPDRLRLDVGDRVDIRVRRDGRDRRFRVRAAARPSDVRASNTFRLPVETDSMVETMVRAMDSLKVRLSASGRSTARIVSTTGDGRDEVTVVGRDVRDVIRAPFEFFVFRGEQHDSLRREMETLNGLMGELRTRERQRLREISRAGQAVRADLQDDQLVELRGALEDVNRQSATLRAAMAEAARATAGLDYTYAAEPSASVPGPEREPRSFRPLTPYLLGSNLVAGAQVVDLRPELAAYFDVEGGVLIVDVSPGTPAAIAGIVPGDVVTRMDQVGVGSVEHLRFGVAQAGDTLPITLVRQGQSLQVLLRRR